MNESLRPDKPCDSRVDCEFLAKDKLTKQSVGEKQEMLELGEPIGSGLKHLISIVSYGSFLRWKRQATSGEEPKKWADRERLKRCVR